MVAGAIHLTRLQAHLSTEYDWLAQEIRRNQSSIGDKDLKTRLLLGFALEHLAGCPRTEIYRHITDGPNDRGIDAFFFDRINLRAYLIQSKYVDEPASSPISEADAKSLAAGANEVFQLSIFEHGNSKIKDLRPEIVEAISTTGVELFPILVSTSDRDIAGPSRRILEDSFQISMGDREALEYHRLSDLYEIISPFGGGAGARFELMLNGFNMVPMPFNGYYGWVTGGALATLYKEQGVKLFAKNLRSGLGETDINDDMYRTALESPEKFWYFNNGVTFVCESATRSLLGGAAADNVALTITNGSIVNGAQTTSTLARLLEMDGGAKALGKLKCLVRVLEIPSDSAEFSTEVTRFNNSQNGIGVKDFVSLDPFQQELRRGLDREFAVNYIIRSGEDSTDGQVPSITLQEATTALVSCGHSLDNAVRAKDKISVLWRDTNAAPYTVIFDSAKVTPLALFKAVEAARTVDLFLRDRMDAGVQGVDSETHDRERAVATHGNRLFAFYVLRGLNIWRASQGLDQFREKMARMNLAAPFEDFVREVFEQYGSSYKAPLFKNRTKCESIIKALPSVLPPVS